MERHRPAEAAAAVAEAATEALPPQAIDAAAFQTALTNMLGLLKGPTPILYGLLANPANRIEGHRWVVQVPSEHSEAVVQKHRDKLQDKLREDTGNPTLALAIEVVAPPAEATPVGYTADELQQKLIAENPALADLMQRFNTLVE